MIEVNNVYCEDCLVGMQRIPDKSIDVCLTDPPYNVGLDYCEGDKRKDYKEWCNEWFNEILRVSKFIAFTPGMVNISMWVDIKEPLWYGSWRKSNQCSSSRLGGFNAWEPILFYGKPVRRIGHDAWDMPIGQQQNVGDHPCPKYLPFWEKLISSITNETHTVLDPFMGSGTTAIACINTNRNYIGFEKEEKYFNIIQDRIKKHRPEINLFNQGTEPSTERRNGS